jgi:hypothetical protein
MTRVNKWTLGLAAVGLVSLPAVVQAEEKPNQLLTALSSTTISGYVDTSAHWTLGKGNLNPPPYAFNTANKQDGFNLNAVNLVLEKPLDEGTWSAGYKVDLIFGPNAVAWNNSFNNQWTGSLNADNSDLAVKQAYVALRAPVGNGIDLKIGTFDTIIGYEVFNSGSNPNYTRSYGYTIEPTQHTGVLASYQVNKIIGFSAGVANTWSPGINYRSERSESDKSYMGAITLTAPDDLGFLAGSALYLGVVDGYSAGIGNDVTSYYVGGTLATPVKNLKLGFAYDYARGHDNEFEGPGIPDGASQTGFSQAVALYASLQATEKLSFHLRGEWAELSLGDLATFDEFGDPVVGNLETSEIIAVTGTIQYDLWANVLSRLEVRWDQVQDGPLRFGGNHRTGSDAGKKDEVLVAGNIIYKF